MPIRPVPVPLLERFDAILEKRAVAQIQFPDYKKWLKYFLDFCTKYPVPRARPEQVGLFIEKLREKKQTPFQQNQAAHAVSLYFEMQRKSETPVADLNTDPTTSFDPDPLQVRDRSPVFPQPIPPKTASSVVPVQRQPWRLWEDGYAVKSDSPEWDAAIAGLAAEIKIRHYSRKTLKTYAHWSRQFQRFLKNKPPKSLSSKDVKEYLTYLAVQCKVSASTQNQAFNALLFLFRHALKQDFGDYKDVPRAKKSKYIPIVLSRKEKIKQANLFVKGSPCPILELNWPG